jgi:hypothetical protein
MNEAEVFKDEILRQAARRVLQEIAQIEKEHPGTTVTLTFGERDGGATIEAEATIINVGVAKAWSFLSTGARGLGRDLRLSIAELVKEVGKPLNWP